LKHHCEHHILPEFHRHGNRQVNTDDNEEAYHAASVVCPYQVLSSAGNDAQGRHESCRCKAVHIMVDSLVQEQGGPLSVAILLEYEIQEALDSTHSQNDLQ
jgi:hypothetical protein